MGGIKGCEIDGRELIVRFEDGKALTFADCWLRDHCRCPSCFIESTKQRAQHILDIPADVTIVKAGANKSSVHLKWSDNHESTFDGDFLRQFDYQAWKNARRSKAKLWRGTEIATKVARVPADKFINGNGAKAVLQSLVDYGIALIEQAEPTAEATEEVGKALGGIQHTFYGGLWKVSANAEHADTAYTNLTLKQHTDNTYFTEGAGLQAFHCTEHNGTGGDNVFVDGFYAAKRLKEDHPEDFDFLTKFNLEAEYVGDGHFHKNSAPTIELDQFGDVKKIRFNSYDRSPMAFADTNECRMYYRALRNFTKYFEDSQNLWQMKLKPGTVLVFDNFRVLHGRTAFTGTRVLWGFYVSRSDWLDRARTLDILP